MKNYRFKLMIRPEDIYNKLLPEQKEKINNVQITKAKLLDSGDLVVNCLALEGEVVEYPDLQTLSFDNEPWYITVKEI